MSGKIAKRRMCIVVAVVEKSEDMRDAVDGRRRGMLREMLWGDGQLKRVVHVERRQQK
jgi:hypothetical protein